jgi:hypothetical protein
MTTKIDITDMPAEVKDAIFAQIGQAEWPQFKPLEGFNNEEILKSGRPICFALNEGEIVLIVNINGQLFSLNPGIEETFAIADTLNQIGRDAQKFAFELAACDAMKMRLAAFEASSICNAEKPLEAYNAAFLKASQTFNSKPLEEIESGATRLMKIERQALENQ